MRRLFKVGAERHDVGSVTFSWHPEGNFLASAGRNGIIHITDRHGDIIDEIPMSTSAPVLSLEWDKDGEYLAILQDGNGVVPLWNLSSRRVIPLETNLKDPTFLAWSQTGPQLAVGTAKGSLLIYNKTRRLKIPIVGKHSKRIRCGAWSAVGNKLVLGSDDRTLTISNESGDTLLHTELKHTPEQTLFTRMNSNSKNSKSAEDNTVSANLSGKSLLLYDIMNENEDPMELTFAPSDSGGGCRYGDIVKHYWYDEGLALIGFSGGYLLSVSTNSKDLGEEKYSVRFHKHSLFGFAFSQHSKRAATAGDDGVRIIDTRDFSESKKDFISTEDLEDGRVTDLCWSPDGQILTIGTSAGNVYNFLAKMSVLHANYKTSIAYLSSLREVSIVDAVRRSRPIDVTVKLEPSLIALGAKHVAAGMNNRVYYHRIAPNSGSQVVNEQEYIGVVREIQLNHSFAAVLTDSKVILHPIEPAPNAQEQTKQFPSREEGSFAKVTCIGLTDDFLYYGTEAGTVEVFFLGEWVQLSGAELRLDNPVRRVFPNNSGTRVVVVDHVGQSFLFNPVTGGGVNQSISRFEGSPQNITSVLWDVNEKNVISFYDGKFMHTFLYLQTSIKGPLLIKLGPVEVSAEGEVQMNADRVDIAAGNSPVVSIGGTITCQMSSGNLTTIAHPFFDILNADTNAKSRNRDRDEGSGGKSDKKALIGKFCQALALMKLEDAWNVALDLDRRHLWLALSGKAMEMLNIELAMRVYRQLGDAGMVMALQECMNMEDKNLLAGQISLLFCDYQRAQDLFLASSRPSAALDLRRDLLQWDQALKLAQVLSSNQIPDICIQYGQQLESREETDAALKMFESALNAQDSETGQNICPEPLVRVALMGVARCNMRLGNIKQGIRLANELSDKELYIDCGDLLELHKQYSEAASMYIKGEQFEKAGFIYTKYLIKNDKGRIPEAAKIMEHVDNDNLNSAFAKACAAAGRYDDAARAYERAKDMDKVVEIKMRHLDQVQQAFDLVRESSSAQGAQHVAEYCQEISDFRGAIEFLLIANKSDEAFKLAKSQSIVDVYTGFIGENIGAEEAVKVAHYYEKQQDYGRAGRFYSLCGQHARALKLFMQCGDREIDAAIEVVGKSQNEGLTHQLIDFLVGEKDGVPKDPNYIYRLYLALKKYEDAAKTALIIARQEQDLGNYALARSVVFETIRQLEDSSIKVPLQLRQSFVLLHSYMLVRTLVRHGDHMGASRLLLRVSQSVSKFPMHVVQILTSTVIECQRAGLKAQAFEYSTMLMRPEYRPLIDVNLKRKIEAIVRRRHTSNPGDEPAEECSEDPISKQQIPVSQLECPTTRDALPMCAVSGRHLTLTDWCFCPVSKAPVLYSQYVAYIENEIAAAVAAEEKAQAAAAAAAAVTAAEEGKSEEGGRRGRDRDRDGNRDESKRGSPLSSPNSASAAESALASAAAAVASKMAVVNITTALDPILGKPVAAKDLVLSTPEEAMEYIQRYNNVVKKKEGAATDQEPESAAGDVTEGGGGTGAGAAQQEGSRRHHSRKLQQQQQEKGSTGAAAAGTGSGSSGAPSGKEGTAKYSKARMEKEKRREKSSKSKGGSGTGH